MTGQIHDLGYKRYVGSRRALGTRWRVIMRHQIATAWKGWWRYKLPLIAALLVTAILAGVLYFLSGNMFGPMRGFAGELIKLSDGILPFSASFGPQRLGCASSNWLTVMWCYAGPRRGRHCGLTECPKRGPSSTECTSTCACTR